MTNIFNLEQIYSEILQRNPSLGQTNNFHFFMHMQQDPAKTNSTSFNRFNIGTNDLIQTSSAPLYQSINANLNFDTANIIGKSSTNATVYGYNIRLTDNLYDSFVQTVFRLQLGTIGISHTPKLQHFDDYYENQRNQIEWAPILFGTGQYMNKRGYVAFLTATAPIKLVIVFITNEEQAPSNPFPV